MNWLPISIFFILILTKGYQKVVPWSLITTFALTVLSTITVFSFSHLLPVVFHFCPTPAPTPHWWRSPATRQQQLSWHSCSDLHYQLTLAIIYLSFHFYTPVWPVFNRFIHAMQSETETGFLSPSLVSIPSNNQLLERSNWEAWLL